MDIETVSTSHCCVVLGANGSIMEQGIFSELSRNSSRASLSDALIIHRDEDKRNAARVPVVPVPKASNVEDAQQDLARRIGDTTVYLYYARSVGWKYGLLILLTSIIFTSGTYRQGFHMQ
jgi:ATP-binding cassette subfamily C (CFTR/MRP) protein 1